MTLQLVTSHALFMLALSYASEVLPAGADGTTHTEAGLPDRAFDADDACTTGAGSSVDCEVSFRQLRRAKAATEAGHVSTPVTANASALGADAEGQGCLCVFDVDRTLTGRQGDTCSHQNIIVKGLHDPAYGGGPLTLSRLGSGTVKSTFCGGCALGLVTRGNAGGPPMRIVISKGIMGGRASSTWSRAGAAAPLIVGCADRKKAFCVTGILKYYLAKGMRISKSSVFFFDDRVGAVSSFKGSGMNAKQVSCATRDGKIGRCGASPEEISRTMGITFCK